MFTWLKSLFAKRQPPAVKRAPTTRLIVETLEDRTTPAFLTAEFPGAGLWLHSDASTSVWSAGWHQLTTANASLVSVDDLHGSVVAEFQGSGVWRFNANTSDGAIGWKQLTPADAALISINNHGGVAADFPSVGVWRYSDYPGDSLNGWQQLTTFDAKQVVAYDLSGDVAASFSSGVWIDNVSSGNWQRITPAVATTMDAAYGNIVCDLSDGIWSYVNGSWEHLTTYHSASLGIDYYGDVVSNLVDGVWRWNQNSGTGAIGWTHLSTVNSQQVDMGGFGTIAVNFGGGGMWEWTTSHGWVEIPTPGNLNASLIDVGDS